MADVYLRLLQKTNGKNLKIENNWFWCPLNVGDFAKNKYFVRDGRLLYTIIMYVYAKHQLSDKDFEFRDARDWSRVLLEFGGNRWLKSNLETYVRKTYEPYLKEWPQDGIDGKITPDEFMALSFFHYDQDMDKLVSNLIGFGILKTQPDWDSNYIYFRSVQKTDLSLENEKKYIFEKSNYKRFFWMDVGGWSSHSAIVGIVTPYEVAMYDAFGNSKAVGNCRRPASGTLADQISKSLREVLEGEGGLVFYQDLKQIPLFKTPVLKNEVIFVIPDLHLHLFKGSLADNFQDSMSGMLDQILGAVLQVVEEYGSKVKVRIIQVGDLYELWESAMLLCIGLNPDWDCVNKTYDSFKIGIRTFQTLALLLLVKQVILPTFLGILTPALSSLALAMKPPDQKEMVKYIRSIEAEVKGRKLDEIFSQPMLDKLRLPWTIVNGDKVETNPAAKDVWEKIQEEIEKAHQTFFVPGTRGKFNFPTLGDKIEQKIIAGNHDSFLGHDEVHEAGINNVIRFEHLHYNDLFNKPSNMEAGQFFTTLNLIAETRGVGGQAKAIEGDRRRDFLINVATVNWDRYKKGKSMYDLIITGHTHRAYAQVITLKLSDDIKLAIESNEGDVKYNQGWSTPDKDQWLGLLKLIDENQNEILGGMAAMGWIGAMKLFWSWRVKPSKPF